MEKRAEFKVVLEAVDSDDFSDEEFVTAVRGYFTEIAKHGLTMSTKTIRERVNTMTGNLMKYGNTVTVFIVSVNGTRLDHDDDIKNADDYDDDHPMSEQPEQRNIIYLDGSTIEIQNDG